MSELRRWSEDGATPSELALLQASRRERPPSSARARTLGALGVGFGALASMTTAAGTAGGAAVLTKVVGVTLLLGGATVGGIVWQSRVHSPNVAETTGPHRPQAAVAAGTSASFAQRTVPPPGATMEIETSTPKTAARGPKSAPPRMAVGTLSIEVAALERVRDALAARDFDVALGALDRYQARFLAGDLAPEATVLRVEALLGRGDRALAAATANDFTAKHPESPYASRMQRLVRDEQNH
jgi:hypothetical protein